MLYSAFYDSHPILFLWGYRRRQTDAFARLVKYATAHMYLAVAHILGVCPIPEGSTMEFGMPLFDARGKSLCDPIVTMNKKTRTHIVSYLSALSGKPRAFGW